LFETTDARPPGAEPPGGVIAFVRKMFRMREAKRGAQFLKKSIAFERMKAGARQSPVVYKQASDQDGAV
jgi:hypothetical protein